MNEGIRVLYMDFFHVYKTNQFISSQTAMDNLANSFYAPQVIEAFKLLAKYRVR